MIKHTWKAGLVGAVLLASGCAGTQYSQYQYTAAGAALGGLGGAVIGKQVDEDNGALIGGAAGAVIGGAVGNQMDRRRASGGYGYNYQSQPDYQYGYSQPAGGAGYPSYPVTRTAGGQF